MIPKKNRATKKIIDLIFKSSSIIRSQNLLFRFFLDKNDNLPRISFITPKNITKSAVKRNLLRRRGYNAVFKFLDKFPSGFSGVFVFSKKGEQIFGQKGLKKKESLKNLEKEIEILINKVNFFKN